MEFEEDRQKMRAGDLKVEREFGEGSVDFRGAADRVSLEEAAGFLLAHCQVIREMETVPLLDCRQDSGGGRERRF